jgi:mono/diheme cytochrome c family protein
MALSVRVFGVIPLAVCFAAAGSLAPAPQSASNQLSADAPSLTPEGAKALKNPIPNTANSISRGRLLYGSLGCAACHGNDGKALLDVVANATDLTNPSVWKNGTDQGLIFRSIRDGAGLAMPPFKTQVTEQEDIWHLVNFIRNLWPEGQRPPVAARSGYGAFHLRVASNGDPTASAATAAV